MTEPVQDSIKFVFQIINLKADLVKKQEEFRLKRLAQADLTSGEASTSIDEYESNKRSSSIWGKKKASSVQTENEASMRERIHKEPAQSLAETEAEAFEKSKRTLEAKAKFYEQITLGHQQPGKFLII